MSSGPSVTVLFVTYNSAGVIGAALDSVPQGVDIRVVDNASEDTTLQVCRDRGIEPIRLDENIGYGAAANLGIRGTESDYVFLLNPDIVLDADCLDILTAAAETHTGIGLFGPSQFRDAGGVKIDHDKPVSLLVPQERTGTMLAENVQEVDFLLGSAYLIRRTAFDAVGGFDENIFLFYEDDDFCRRLRDAGWARALVTDAGCHHAVGLSTPVTPEIVYAKNWHIGWSECYARRKHGLPVPTVGPYTHLSLKVMLHIVSGNRLKRAKAAGALRGRRDFARGVSARARRISDGRLQAAANG